MESKFQGDSSGFDKGILEGLEKSLLYLVILLRLC